jgi:hypothetical protein
MHNHHRTMRILENALRVRAQHPAMKNGVATFAQDNEAGLDGLRAVKYLFRRMAHNNICFEFDLFFLGAYADRNETELIALTRVFEDRVELRALGGFRRTNHSENDQLGFHISRHRQGDIQSVLRVWRRVECNQYPLKSNKNRASHGNDLYLSCSGRPLHSLF